MRASTLAAALLLAVPASGAPRESRPRVSANGVYSVKLTERAPGSCLLEVQRESGTVWELAACVGEPDDFFFPSNDGEEIWVVRPLVEKGKRKTWSHAPVAWRVDRKGQRLEERRLADLAPRSALPEVRQLARHFKWLEGTLGIPGKGPRMTDAGVVELETVGTHTVRLPFGRQK